MDMSVCDPLVPLPLGQNPYLTTPTDVEIHTQLYKDFVDYVLCVLNGLLTIYSV